MAQVLSEREQAVARAVALAFLHYSDSALSLVEIARIVAPDDARDTRLQSALTETFRKALDEAAQHKETMGQGTR